MSDPTDSPPGIDVARVTRWIVEHDEMTVAPLRFRLISGGHSNLTYEVRDARGRRVALRRPPLRGTLPSAHDMAREHTIISALHPTAVPVARPFGHCTDPAVTGAPFYLMEFVDGLVLRDARSVADALDEPTMARATEQMTHALAAIHGIEPDSVGLGQLGRHGGYVERQLHRWITQWRRSGADAAALAERVHERLAARVPAQRHTGIVHGDYRLDNLVLSGSGDVLAVLDWELATLGDTRADLGMLMAYWPDAYSTVPALRRLPHAAAGMPSRDTVIASYQASAGTELRELEYFEALGYWRLASICQGVYTRYSTGAQGADDVDVSDYPDLVRQLLGAADGLV